MIAALRANIAATIFGALAAIFAIIAVVQTVKLDGFLWFDGVRDKLETATTNLNECRAGREADRTAYREAQARAAEMNRAEVQRIETQQKEITDDIQARYLSDLARLKRLRQQPAPEGSSRGSQAGEVPNPATGVDGENLPVPRSELLRCENDAAEIELKSNYLIDWVKQQLGVER